MADDSSSLLAGDAQGGGTTSFFSFFASPVFLDFLSAAAGQLSLFVCLPRPPEPFDLIYRFPTC